MPKSLIQIRKSQLITGFGPGSIVNDLEGDGLMILAPRHWSNTSRLKSPVQNETLRQKLGAKMLVSIKEAGNESFPDITAVRIPRWSYCSRCRLMTKQASFSLRKSKCSNPECSSKKYRGKKSTLVTVRLLAMCEKGHIADFPFQEFIHGDTDWEDHSLTYNIDSRKSGMSSVLIKCETCNKSKRLDGVLSNQLTEKHNLTCRGESPWLLEDNQLIKKEKCDKDLVGVQKSSSNIYFPIVQRSIAIPIESDVDDIITSSFEDFNIREKVNSILSENDFPREVVWKIVKSFSNRMLNDSHKEQAMHYFYNPPNVELNSSFEELEYHAFNKFVGSVKNKDWSGYRYSGLDLEFSWASLFEEIIPMDRIKITNAFCGFSRVKPFEEIEDESLSKLSNRIKQSYGYKNIIEDVFVDEIRGEGIFFKIDYAKLSLWANHDDVKNEYKKLGDDAKSVLNKKYRNPEQFLALHSLSHALIHSFSKQSGYPLSSLSEIIYTPRLGDETSYSGILIFTANSDGDGSLGGLYSLGEKKRLSVILNGLVKDNKWCSSDPVCSGYGASGVQSSNLAACHNCLILPETSCGYFNEYLHRGFLTSANSNHTIEIFS